MPAWPSAEIVFPISPVITSAGRCSIADTRRPVPTLLGHEVKYPTFWSKQYWTSVSILLSMSSAAFQTFMNCAPGSIAWMRTWSSSFTITLRPSAGPMATARPPTRSANEALVTCSSAIISSSFLLSSSAKRTSQSLSSATRRDTASSTMPRDLSRSSSPAEIGKGRPSRFRAMRARQDSTRGYPGPCCPNQYAPVRGALLFATFRLQLELALYFFYLVSDRRGGLVLFFCNLTFQVPLKLHQPLAEAGALRRLPGYLPDMLGRLLEIEQHALERFAERLVATLAAQEPHLLEVVERRPAQPARDELRREHVLHQVLLLGALEP